MRSGAAQRKRVADDRESREIQWRLAAGLILLAGVFSLISSMSQFDGTGTDGVFIPADMRRMVTGQDQVHRPSVTVETAFVSDAMAPGVVWPDESSSRSFSLLRRVESYIQHYPWLTLMLGLGIGYLLSRRMR